MNQDIAFQLGNKLSNWLHTLNDGILGGKFDTADNFFFLNNHLSALSPFTLFALCILFKYAFLMRIKAWSILFFLLCRLN